MESTHTIFLWLLHSWVFILIHLLVAWTLFSRKLFLFSYFKIVSSVLLFLWYSWVRLALALHLKNNMNGYKMPATYILSFRNLKYYSTPFLFIKYHLGKVSKTILIFCTLKMTCSSYTCMSIWFLILKIQQKYSWFPMSNSILLPLSKLDYLDSKLTAH